MEAFLTHIWRFSSRWDSVPAPAVNGGSFSGKRGGSQMPARQLPV